MVNPTKYFNLSWFLICAIGSSIWCVTTANQWGPTFDEPTYVDCGLQCWRTGSHKPLMRLGTMPLPVDTQTFPLWVAENIRGIPFDVKKELDLILPWARGMNLLFWWMLLFFGWKIGKELGNDWGGRLAVFFLATEPNLTSHAALATTDISLAACILGFVYFYLLGQGKSWGKRVGLPSLWFAFAMSAKASALPFVPLIMIGVEIWKQGKFPREKLSLEGQGTLIQRLKPFVKDSFQIGAIGLGLLFLFCGTDWQTERTFVEWARQLPDGSFKLWMIWVSENLKIFTNAGEGIAQQVKHNFRGHGSYILGYESPRALWYYFPVLLSIKCGTAFLVIALLSFLGGAKHWKNILLPVAALLFLFSFNCRVQIGIRFLFPFISLMAILLGTALANWKAQLQLEKKAWGIAMATAICFVAGEWLASWPHGLSYINAVWWTNAGYKLVCDSNYDWGQGLKELSQWKAKEQGNLSLCYYGTDPNLFKGWVEVLPIQELARHSPNNLPQIKDGWLAISTTLVYGPTLLPGHKQWKEFFQLAHLETQVGPFLLYKVETLQKMPRTVLGQAQ